MTARVWAIGLAGAAIAGLGAVAPVAVAGQERALSDGVYTEDQARRGRRIYRQTCTACHADNLEGGEMGPGLKGDPFLGPWDGASLGELMELVQITMPQDNPGGLSEQDYQDVMAYMLSANDFPAGAEDLTADSIADVEIAQ